MNVGIGLRKVEAACALVCAAALACVVALVALVAGAAPARAATPPDLGPWRFESHTVGFFTRSQGIATDPELPGITLYSWQLGLEWAGPSGHSFRNLVGIPLQLLFAGYLHIGDIDTHGAKAYVPYENSAKGTEKAYGAVDVASGRILGWSVHQLDPGEAYNNSWTAVSPDGQWLVSGEWENITSFLVFRVADVGKASIDVVSRIVLDAPLTLVQGCDFDGPLRLVCQDDTAERRLLQVDLDRALDGADVAARTTVLGTTPVDLAIPWLAPMCKNHTEAEGVDVSADGSTLRFLTVDPCLLWSHEYRYSAG